MYNNILGCCAEFVYVWEWIFQIMQKLDFFFHFNLLLFIIGKGLRYTIAYYNFVTTTEGKHTKMTPRTFALIITDIPALFCKRCLWVGLFLYPTII